jgi:hypothetical protein
MRITINGETIDYTLENEEYTGDVYAGVSKWLDEGGYVVSKVAVDGVNMAPDDTEWQNRPIKDIEVLDLQALTRRESRLENLGAARDSFLLVKEMAETKNTAVLKEITESFSRLLAVLPGLLEGGGAGSSASSLTIAVSGTGYPPKLPVDDQGWDSLAATTGQAAQIIDDRIGELAHPEEEALAAAKALVSIEGGLTDVAVQLHTGKDREAMGVIIGLAELLQKLFRSLAWVNDEGVAEKAVPGLKEILMELEGALENGDTVLIGDLLEYEIRPRLQDLPRRLTEVLPSTKE